MNWHKKKGLRRDDDDGGDEGSDSDDVNEDDLDNEKREAKKNQKIFKMLLEREQSLISLLTSTAKLTEQFYVEFDPDKQPFGQREIMKI